MKTRMMTHAIKLTVVISVMLLGNTIKAQNHRRPMPPRGIPDSTQVIKMVDSMAQKLNLTDEQKQKFVELHLNHFKQVKAMQDQMKNSGEGVRNRKMMESLRQEFDKKLKSMLTDEQKVEFDKLMQENSLKREEPRRPNRPKRMN